MEKTRNASLTIRLLESIDELSNVCDLEKIIWESDDPVPVSHLITAVKNGGMVLGAYLEEQLIGFQYSFAGFDGKKAYLCSHTLGVHPNFRISGIGEKLKLAQRTEAIKKGYDLITWTYDPLETVNANLNMKKLGGTCSTYIENCYGEMSDILNVGVPSDRFLVEWQIKDDHVIHKLSNEIIQNRFQEDLSVIRVEINDQGFPIPVDNACRSDQSADVLFVPVPGEFQKIKDRDLHLAIEWRMKTRKVFNQYFQSGWQVIDFFKSKTKNKGDLDIIHYYVLQKKEGIKWRSSTSYYDM